MSMYPSLHENQAYAQQALRDPAPTDSTSCPRSNKVRSLPASTHMHHPQAARTRRPPSGRISPGFFNAVYFPNHRVLERHLPSHLPVRYISHIYYGFALCDYDGTIRLSNERVDCHMDVDGYEGAITACLALKRLNPGLKVLLSVGGIKGSIGFPYATQEHLRKNLAKTLRRLVINHGFDGVDINWETPKDLEEGKRLVQLIAIMRGWLPKEDGFTITVALSGRQWALENIPQLDEIMDFADMMNLMTFDFAGPWSPRSSKEQSEHDTRSGHHSQLLASTLPGTRSDAPSVQAAVNFLRSKGTKMSRVLIGVPCHGQAFVGVDGPGQQSASTYERKYRELPTPVPGERTDRMVKAAHCMETNNWVSYDNVETTRQKGAFVIFEHLGGLFYWDGTNDKPAASQSLILAGYESLRGG